MTVMRTLPEPERISDAVFETLRQAIFRGELAPGERLSVPVLASRLGVSRSPVREAVQRLVQEGLAVEEARRGAAVASIRPEELVPLYETREVLEGLAARTAALRCTPAQVSELATNVAEHAAVVRAGDTRAHVELDMRFHAALRKIAGNEHLSAFLEKLQNKIAIAMLSADTTSWPKKAVAEHRQILEAIRAGDPGRAETMARAHIVRVRGDLEARSRH